MVSHWSLSDSMSPQVSHTLLSILSDLNKALVWMVFFIFFLLSLLLLLLLLLLSFRFNKFKLSYTKTKLRHVVVSLRCMQKLYHYNIDTPVHQIRSLYTAHKCTSFLFIYVIYAFCCWCCCWFWWEGLLHYFLHNISFDEIVINKENQVHFRQLILI